MTVAKVTEISATSTESFDDAIRVGIARALMQDPEMILADVNEMKVDVEGGEITAYRVNMKVTFVLKD